MIRIRLTLTDVSQVRFGFSPLSETVLSLRALASNNSLHAPWVGKVRPQLDAENIEFLQTLVRPAGYIPDFLTPPVSRAGGARSAGGFDTALERVEAADPLLVATQLRHLERHEVAQRGPGRPARQDLLRALVKDPERAVTRVTTALKSYWRTAVEPYWPRIHALLQADLSYRLDELATGGIGQVLKTLHPLVTHRGEFLDIAKYWDGTVELGHRGLLLVPCVFAWPDVVVRSADPQPALTYSPRGLGRLWETTAGRNTTALADLIGRSRAAVLTQLDLPMTTTQLALLLALTPPTLSVHLKTLEAVGVVTARRDGRAVLYQRTGLGEQLLGHRANRERS
jgi:DNA-binding transcriptional ArsR family regulator